MMISDILYIMLCTVLILSGLACLEATTGQNCVFGTHLPNHMAASFPRYYCLVPGSSAFITVIQFIKRSVIQLYKSAIAFLITVSTSQVSISVSAHHCMSGRFSYITECRSSGTVSAKRRYLKYDPPSLCPILAEYNK